MEGADLYKDTQSAIWNIQMVTKLSSQAKSKLSKQKTGFDSNTKNPFLEKLAALCGHPSVSIQSCSRNCLLSLIGSGLVNCRGTIDHLYKLIHQSGSLSGLLTTLVHLDLELLNTLKSGKRAEQSDLFNQILNRIDKERDGLSVSTAFRDMIDIASQSGDATKLLARHTTFISVLVSDRSLSSQAFAYQIISTCVHHGGSELLVDLLDAAPISNGHGVLAIIDMILSNSFTNGNKDNLKLKRRVFRLALVAIYTSSSTHTSLWRQLGRLCALHPVLLLGNEGLLVLLCDRFLSASFHIINTLLDLVEITLTTCKQLYLVHMFDTPLLQLSACLNLQPVSADSELLNEKTKRVAQLLREYKISDGDDQEQVREDHVNSAYLQCVGEPELYSLIQDCDWLSTDIEFTLTYLNNVKNYLSGNPVKQPGVLWLFKTVSILLNTLSTQAQLAALDVFSACATKIPHQAAYLLPVLISEFICRHGNHPDVTLAALDILPAFAANKANVGPILMFLDHLESSSSLCKVQVLRLLCEICEKQPRTYPHLIKKLHRKPQSELEQIAISKALLFTCDNRDEQYGPDVVPLLSKIISQDWLATAVSQAILAVCSLIEAETVDLITTWGVLSTTLELETRPIVLKSVCHLLSLSHVYSETSTPQQLSFQSECITKLWQYSRHPNPCVVSAAYFGLADFTAETIRYQHIPHQIAQYAPDYTENPEKYDNVPVNPEVLVNLLTDSMDEEAAEGYQYWLSHLLDNEITSFGRTVGKTSKQTNRQNLSREITLIPKDVERLYMASGDQARSHTTVAYMLTRECLQLSPSPNKAELRSIVSDQKACLDRLVKVIYHATVPEIRDVQYMSTVLQAWNVYMKYCLETVVEGRKADIVLQGNTVSRVNSQLPQIILWSRDRIQLIVTTSSHSSKSVNSRLNSLLAQSSLVNATRKVATAAQVKHGKLCTQLLALEQTWLKNLVSLANDESVEDFTLPEDYRATSTVFLALCIAVPPVYKSHSQILESIIQTLCGKLRKECEVPDELSTLTYSSGFLLAVLLDNRCDELMDEQICLLMDTCIDLLLTQAEGRLAAAQASKPDYALLQIMPYLKDNDRFGPRVHKLAVDVSVDQHPVSNLLCQKIYTMAVLNHHNTQDMGELSRLVRYSLDALSNKDRDGVAGLGLLLLTMRLNYHPKSAEFHELFTQRIEFMIKSDEIEVQDAAVAGLINLTGLNSSIIQVHQQRDDTILSLFTRFHSHLSSLNKQTPTKFYSWVIGSLWYTAHNSGKSQDASVGATYKASLPVTSLLRAAVARIHRSMQTLEVVSANKIIQTLLGAVAAANKGRQLPLLNWQSLCTPLLSANDAKLQYSCMEIVCHQTSKSAHAASLVSKYISPRYFSTLQTEAQQALLQNFHRYVNHIKLTPLSDLVKLLSTNHQIDLLSVLLRSIRKALEDSELSPSTQVFLYQTIQTVYGSLDYTSPFFLDEVRLLSVCVSLCETSLITQLLATTGEQAKEIQHLQLLLCLHLPSYIEQTQKMVDDFVNSLESGDDWLIEAMIDWWKHFSNNQQLQYILYLSNRVTSYKTEVERYVYIKLLSSALIGWTNSLRLPSHNLTIDIMNFYVLLAIKHHPWSQVSKQVDALLGLSCNRS